MLEHHFSSPPEEAHCKKGDNIWLLATSVKSWRPMKKLDNKKLGPFEVSEVISNYAYQLKLPPTMRIHDVFHAKLLSLG